MKNGHTYFKYSVILIIAVFILLLFRRCGDGGGTIIKNDTIKIVRDTTYILHDTTISYVPKPYKVEVQKDSLIFLEKQPTYDDYPEIVKQWLSSYNSKGYYDSTIDVAFGTATLKDTVFKNRIIGRSFKLSQSIPEITNTITLREKKRVVLYAGVTGIGNQTTPIYAVGGKLGIMAKNGKYYGGSYLLTKSGNVMYQADILIPIHLRKNR